jgi:hypothetical protein
MAVQLYSAPIVTTKNMLPAKNKGPNYFGIPTLSSQAELQLLHHFL